MKATQLEKNPLFLGWHNLKWNKKFQQQNIDFSKIKTNPEKTLNICALLGWKTIVMEFEGLIFAESRQRRIGPLQEMQKKLSRHKWSDKKFTIDVYIVYLMNSMKS